LRRLLDKVDEMRKQRIRLINDLREALDKDDITSQALVDPYSDPKPIIKAQLTRHDKLIEVIDQNLAAQENILKALTDANANFADFRRQIVDMMERLVLIFYS
jgi:tyrosine-protein phosphatase non-receptor type 23